MQQTAGPVKRVQLQLSGSNLQPTTQSHSKTPGDNKQGTRQSREEAQWEVFRPKGVASSLQDIKKHGAGDKCNLPPGT